MKTYLENSKQGIQEMDVMYGMSHMMYMQSMYHMMQSMHHMMQAMYPLMDMQGMNSMYEMTPMSRQDNKRQFPIPMLENLEQISPNQIQISYNIDVDRKLGMKPTNYWIQDTMNAIPQGIATLGKNDNVNAGNSLMGSMVRIQSKNDSARTFILTFNQNIPRGRVYKLIICYVTVNGAPPYSGDNGMATFIGE